MLAECDCCVRVGITAVYDINVIWNKSVKGVNILPNEYAKYEVLSIIEVFLWNVRL